MTRLLIDAGLTGQLAGVLQPVELCDASGKVLGRFFPRLDPASFNLEPQISKELQRRRQSREKTYTTAEVLAYLENL